MTPYGIIAWTTSMVMSWHGNSFCITEQCSWDQHGAHLGPTGPRWAQCWPHELCFVRVILQSVVDSPHKGTILWTGDVSFVVRLNKLLSSWFFWWFEFLLWCHCNDRVWSICLIAWTTSNICMNKCQLHNTELFYNACKETSINQGIWLGFSDVYSIMNQKLMCLF